MGRRKIEIKAIKDDRNRSVTFLKRKGGLFKKAHELSVLCSVDVAVFIFGNNKKLYEYSSSDMRDLIHRYQLHGAINEHKGPADFNGGNDDEDDEDVDASPPRAAEGVEPQMMPPQFHGQQPPFSQILRHHTPSASPPIANGVPYHHPGHNPRGATPQPPMGSRPSSRNDGPHPGITYMPTPPIYNPSANGPGLIPQHGYPTQHPPPPPPPPPPSHAAPVAARPQPSPPQPNAQHLPPHPPPPPVEPKTEPSDRPQPPLLNTDTAVKKMPQRKSHSIFTPIEENRSILSQHLASFAAEPQAVKAEPGPAGAAPPHNRSQSVDAPAPALRDGTATSPELKRSSTQGSLDRPRKPSLSSGPDTAFTPPSRASSLKASAAPAGGARPRGPRLTVQIPDGVSEPGSATGESISPHNPAVTPTNAPQRHNSHSSVVLPPPSPSASALLSAGASGPPNPFARPPPQQNVNGETPASALPSRFLGNELLPSPSSFYPDWNFRGSDNHTLPSPLNFATPVVGSGPSFLREDNHALGNTASSNAGTAATGSGMAAGTTAPNNSNGASCAASGGLKRKSPDYGAGSLGEKHGATAEPKRIKVEYA
ncbi:SRF-type transcription factor [Hirsutella rhossiliensis]|uniref:MADS-box MEF2 type transcription factor MIG1 n=1 Tax=Hirsutella rhossiliensis TaxID=111463 RepID=A0A9P8N7Y3_9HYPO|nr:SRF-type transcription factor domain-containing protein [Hirsutella rhossiliensis]KAH0968625.1 SRF-type transcription factor domain-containing protein [Hirsutella rhossiliensis]